MWFQKGLLGSPEISSMEGPAARSPLAFHCPSRNSEARTPRAGSIPELASVHARIGAVMRKMLHVIYGMFKHRQPFDGSKVYRLPKPPISIKVPA